MISIPRSLIRRFRAVARRAGLSRGQIGTIRLVATANSLSLQMTNGNVAVEHNISGSFSAADILVPMQLFTDCEAKNEDAVAVRVEAEQVTAVWYDRGVPQQRAYTLADVSPEMPPQPGEWATSGPELINAIREAHATTDQSATRYALNCIQLKGSTGTITATDSSQLLVQSGFQFPWQDEVLVHATGVFASAELTTASSVEIGRTENFVTVRAGAWTIHHEIDKVGRFPSNVQNIIPAEATIVTRMQIESNDGKFLKDAVCRLPGGDEGDRPLTVDLNGAVVIRARRDAHSPVTELVLSRSQRLGNELRFQTNRKFLARAVEMGYNEIGFTGAESPCVCRDATRTYVWMLLENKGALEASDEAMRIDSSAVAVSRPVNRMASRVASTIAASSVSALPSVVSPVNRVETHLQSRRQRVHRLRIEAAPLLSQSHPLDVIEKALTIRGTLRTLIREMTDLVVQIRQQRKQSKLMKSTLASLKQLQLIDA